MHAYSHLPEIPETFPLIRDLEDIKAIESIPLAQRIGNCWDVNQWIQRGMRREPQKAAFHFLQDADPEETPITIRYEELLARTHQAANLFYSLGVRAGDAVLILLPTFVQIFPAQYGALAAGIGCCVNWMLKPVHLAALIRAANAKVVVALGPTPGFDIWEGLASIRAQLPAGLRVLSVQAPGGSKLPDSDFDTLCARQPFDRQIFERVVTPDEIAAYVHSGGTTGVPKLVKITFRALAYRCWYNPMVCAYGPRDVYFSLSTLFHVTGFITEGILTAVSSLTAVVPSPMNARAKQFVANYWKLVERYRITRLKASPPTMSLLAKNPPKSEDISSLGDFTTVGGSPTPVELAREIHRLLGIRLLNTYGSTEYSQNCMHAPRDGDPRFGSSGIRMPHFQVKAVVLDRHGEIERECSPGEIGVLVVRSPTVTPGYLDDRQNQGIFTREGFFKSRDVGRFDAEGYLWITGRITDLIIRGGHNIEPALIEEPLHRHPQVAIAAAVGKPDAYAGELPVAYVQLVKGASVTERDLLAYAADNVSERAAVPKEVRIVDAIPLTDVGKPHKVKLRHDAAQRVFTAEIALALEGRILFDVKVDADQTHGTAAIITIAVPDPGSRKAIEESIHGVMKQYAVHYEIRLQESTAAGGEP